MWEEVESKNRWDCSTIFRFKSGLGGYRTASRQSVLSDLLANWTYKCFNKWQRERRGAEMRVETRVRRSGTSISWNGTGNERLWTLYNERLLDRLSWNLEPERMGRREANGKSEFGDFSGHGPDFRRPTLNETVNFRWCATRFLNRFAFGWFVVRGDDPRLPSDTWLILPVVICLSQRLSHACLSSYLYTVKLRMAH